MVIACLGENVGEVRVDLYSKNVVRLFVCLQPRQPSLLTLSFIVAHYQGSQQRNHADVPQP